MGKITKDKEQEKIQALLVYVQEEYGNEKAQEILNNLIIAGRNEETLMRYLIVNHMQLKYTKPIIKKTIEWRKEFEVDTILERQIMSPEKKVAIRKYFPNGFHKTDKEGNLLWIARLGHVNYKPLLEQVSVEDAVADHIQVMEYRNKVLAPELVEKLGRIPKTTSILDLSQFHLTTLHHSILDLIKQVSAIDDEYYPEATHKLFIVNTSMFFWTIWSVVQVFLSENIKKKIRILGKNYEKELLECVEKENLPEFLGGTCKCIPSCITCETIPMNPFYEQMEDYIYKQCQKKKGNNNNLHHDDQLDSVEKIEDDEPPRSFTIRKHENIIINNVITEYFQSWRR